MYQLLGRFSCERISDGTDFLQVKVTLFTYQIDISFHIHLLISQRTKIQQETNTKGRSCFCLSYNKFQSSTGMAFVSLLGVVSHAHGLGLSHQRGRGPDTRADLPFLWS